MISQGLHDRVRLTQAYDNGYKGKGTKMIQEERFKIFALTEDLVGAPLHRTIRTPLYEVPYSCEDVAPQPR